MIEIIVGFSVLLMIGLFKKKSNSQKYQEDIVPILDDHDEDTDHHFDYIDSVDNSEEILAATHSSSKRKTKIFIPKKIFIFSKDHGKSKIEQNNLSIPKDILFLEIGDVRYLIIWREKPKKDFVDNLGSGSYIEISSESFIFNVLMLGVDFDFFIFDPELNKENELVNKNDRISSKKPHLLNDLISKGLDSVYEIQKKLIFDEIEKRDERTLFDINDQITNTFFFATLKNKILNRLSETENVEATTQLNALADALNILANGFENFDKIIARKGQNSQQNNEKTKTSDINMDSIAIEFIERIFKNNRSRWWENLKSETNKNKGRCLQLTLKQELKDVPEYRTGDRRLFFFSSHKVSSIDGRYKSLGVEEKFSPLNLEEKLIDGAIHRGVVWVLGNPQDLISPIESVSLYVVKAGSKPLSSEDVDLYFPVLLSIYKLGVHIVFIDEESGEYWKVDDAFSPRPLPNWLSQKSAPSQWDRNIDNITEKNIKALKILKNPKILSKNLISKRIPGFGKKGDFKEININNSCKVAIIDYGNQWRLIELGLLLRSAGYDAVKAIYNKKKCKNKKDQIKDLVVAGRGVEERVRKEMLQRFAVDIDWRCEI